MTNEEKARDITKLVWYPQKLTEYDIQWMLIEMAEWKEQQITKKACKWFKEEGYKYIGFNCITEDIVITDKFIKKFKKVIK